MNISQRIHLNSSNINTDKHIKVKLEQDVDSIEFLSLNISTNDAYGNFNADYGVLVGRVIANDGIGIPNAKISIFIPISDEDKTNSDIYSVYPYTTPRDKNNEGKRYNLLPRVAKKDPITGIVSPKQPFGSFPIKEEIVTNETLLTVYENYYKYTALTNGSGDYMIFGVPIGTQIVHLSVDITDIGKYSMTPAAMVTNLGYSPNFFTDNNTKIKPKNDLNDLPTIETQEISVNIIPFWGDTTNFEIGITQQNFRIRAELVSTFTIFGSAFTDGDNSMWGQSFGTGDFGQVSELHRIRDNKGIDINLGIGSKRIGIVTEKIYYLPNSISDSDILAGNYSPNDFLILDSSEYTSYKEKGTFVYIINCNRHRVITDEFGNEVQVSEGTNSGVYNQFRGFITFEITDEELSYSKIVHDIGGGAKDIADTNLRAVRYKFKIPQMSSLGRSLSDYEFFGDNLTTNNVNKWKNDANSWRLQHKVFSGGTIYSVAKFNPIVHNIQNEDPKTKSFTYQLTSDKTFLATDTINVLNKTVNKLTTSLQKEFQVGLIQTNNSGNATGNTRYQMVSNATLKDGSQVFGGNWLNFSLYFPQVGVYDTINNSWPVSLIGVSKYPRMIYSTSHYTPNFYYVHDEKKSDGNPFLDTAALSTYFYVDGGVLSKQYIKPNDPTINTFGFARSDLHYTDFIKVPKEDILKMNKSGVTKGFIDLNIIGGLNGTDYKSGLKSPCPINGGRISGNTSANLDSKKYFYKGLGDSDCIKFIISLGLV